MPLTLGDPRYHSGYIEKRRCNIGADLRKQLSGRPDLNRRPPDPQGRPGGALACSAQHLPRSGRWFALAVGAIRGPSQGRLLPEFSRQDQPPRPLDTVEHHPLYHSRLVAMRVATNLHRLRDAAIPVANPEEARNSVQPRPLGL
jgi:hypothetical protein